MTGKDSRLDRLAESLTARERAVLILQAWKEGKREDRSWRWTMPDEQAVEFNRLIDLMNGVNIRLGPLVIALRLEVDKLSLRLGWLSTIALWQLHAYTIADEMELHDDDHDESTSLKKRSTKRTPAKAARERARAAFHQGPTAPVPHLPELDLEGEGSMIDELVAYKKKVLRKGIDEQWRQLRTVEIVVADAQKEFGGEDPAHPEMRHVLDHVKEELQGLHEDVRRYTGPFELAEPGEDEIGWVRSIVEQGVRPPD